MPNTRWYAFWIQFECQMCKNIQYILYSFSLAPPDKGLAHREEVIKIKEIAVCQKIFWHCSRADLTKVVIVAGYQSQVLIDDVEIVDLNDESGTVHSLNPIFQLKHEKKIIHRLLPAHPRLPEPAGRRCPFDPGPGSDPRVRRRVSRDRERVLFD